MTSREVWVTGLGAVTAAGVGVDSLRSMIVNETSGVQPQPNLGGFPAGRAPDLPRSRASRHLDRSAKLFLTAAEEAWCQAGLDACLIDTTRCTVIEGSSLGPMAELLEMYRERLEQGVNRLRPSGLIRFMTGAGGAAFAQARNIQGPVLHVSAGSVSATCAIGEAFLKISAGFADVAVAGGAECPLHEDVMNNFRVAGVLAGGEGRDATCRPFDANRSGTVLGEGGGAVVLEAATHASSRGVRPYGVIEGYGLACEAYSMTSPRPDGAGVARSARQALDTCGPDSVGWIKVHGTGTRINDAAECQGLADVFGNRLSEIPLTSLKPMLGHCLGASGAVEGVMALIAFQQGLIPPTLGLRELDANLPPCTVQTHLEERETETMLLLAESFGGRCAALAIGGAQLM